MLDIDLLLLPLFGCEYEDAHIQCTEKKEKKAEYYCAIFAGKVDDANRE